MTIGCRTLKDAINEALRDWVTNVETTHYLLGSAVGPHPFPTIVREFQPVIGDEARAQILEDEGRLPDTVIACVGGGSNAIGIFHDSSARRRSGWSAWKRRAAGGPASMARRSPRAAGRPARRAIDGAAGRRRADRPTRSVSAGLDYPAVGPEHAYLAERGLAGTRSSRIRSARRARAPRADRRNHSRARVGARLAWTERNVRSRGTVDIVNLSGRGDKDVETVRRLLSADGTH